MNSAQQRAEFIVPHTKINLAIRRKLQFEANPAEHSLEEN